jgi:subtilisin family serine protease
VPPRLRKIAFFFLLIFFFFKSFAAFGGEIADDLKSRLNGLQRDEFTSCLVVMADQVNTLNLSAKLNQEKATRRIRHQSVLNSLKTRAQSSQPDLMGYLSAKQLEGSVRQFKSFWITNAVLVTATRREIEKIASRPDVEEVYENYPISLVDPVSVEKSSGNIAERERYLSAVGAREAWNMGYTGAGRLICSLDTGVDGHHPALFSSWRGNNGGQASACWFDPYGSDFPKDDKGHGTHCMGIMAGKTESDTFGVAYGAQWICAAVIDRGASLSQTIADILSVFQWAADPDGDPATLDDVPDVINNSWGVPTGFKPPCDQTFWNAIDNVENAGIVVIFAAGNEGPNAATLRTPADRISSPTNCFSVGAVDPQSYGFPVPAFSSRGPSGCDNQTIKPELCAPGVGIYSCYKNNEYRLMSGTSMAAPFVSAAVAILRQYNPEATVEQIKNALLESCSDLGPVGEDNSYGHGLINIKRALEILPQPDKPNLYLTDLEIDGGNPPQPGDQIDLVVQLRNSGVGMQGVAATLSASDSLIHMVSSVSFLGAVPAGEEVSNTDSPFMVSIDPNMPSGRKIEFTLSVAGQEPQYQCRLSIPLTVGSLPPLSIGDHDAGNFLFTLSNFGQYGLANGSFNPLGGKGWVYPKDGRNRLYEASFMIGAGPDQVSDAARGADGRVPEQDFQALPGGELSIQTPGALSDQEGYCKFSDETAPNPLGVEITQTSYVYSDPAYDDFLILEYKVKNTTEDLIRNAFVGLFFDWDISSSSPDDDQVGFDSDLSLDYQFDAQNETYLSIVPLSDLPHFSTHIDNAQTIYDGFSDAEKFWLLSGQVPKTASIELASQVAADDPEPKDWSSFCSCGPIQLVPQQEVVVGFAIVGGGSLQELKNNVASAKAKYECLCTGLDDDDDEEDNLPPSFSLSQNYPNPFNPVTSIQYSVGSIRLGAADYGPRTADGSLVPTSLKIYNVRGQLVKTLVEDRLPPGRYQVSWDGTDDAGVKVASGVYLYRLQTGNDEVSRKMILLK